jgi:hypothetical protein
MLLAVDTLPQTDAPVRWRLATRLAFRWSVAYFTLYVCFTQMLSGLLVLPAGNLPQIGVLPPMRNLVEWVARHVFGVTQPLVIFSGSGDKIYDWVQAFCFIVLATIVTAVWSVLDRRRERYSTSQAWFRLFLRFALGSTMVSYGMVKAIPLQMPAPSLARLLEPYGHFSPMGVLWASIGASRSYEIFAGAAELVAGVLLFIPGLTTLGSIVCAAIVTQVFVLNMTYDVPVKLFSFHLLLMSLVLLAPDLKRVAAVLVFNRASGPSIEPPLVPRRRAVRAIAIAQIALGLYLVGMNLKSGMESWTRYGGGAPKSALYGIWDVDWMWIDGKARLPLLNDYGRWRRLSFQAPANMAFHRMDDTVDRYGVAIDAAAGTLTLSRANDKAWTARFTFTRPAPNRLTLDGTMEGRAVKMDLSLVDHTKFQLLNRRFNWVQEYPFNR